MHTAITERKQLMR